MNRLAFSLFISCSLYSLSAYGGNNLPTIDEESQDLVYLPRQTTGKETDQSNPGKHLKRKKADENENSGHSSDKDLEDTQKKLCLDDHVATDAKVTLKNFPLEMLLKSYPGIGKIIVGFMPPQEQQFLARGNKNTHDLVVRYRMGNDLRNLQDQLFVNGPSLHTPEAYRFNAAVWHALRQMLIVTDEKRKQPVQTSEQLLTQAEPIAKVCTFLKMTFPHYSATERVFTFLTDGYTFLLGFKPAFVLTNDLITLAGDKKNRMEQELMRQWNHNSSPNYNPTQGFHADNEVDPDQMWLVKRHYLVSQKRMVLQTPQPQNLDASQLQAWEQQRATDWNFIAQYGVVQTVWDYRSAAFHYYNAKNFTRAAQLREEVLSKYPNEAKADDYRRASAAHYQAKNFVQAALRFEEVLSKYPNEAKANDYRIAALTHAQTRNFVQAALRLEEVLSNYPNEAKTDDYRRAAAAHSQANNHVQAAKFWEEVLSKYPNEAMAMDYRRAADAHYCAKNFVQAALRFEEVLSKYPNEAMAMDYRRAAGAHFRTKNFSRSAELWIKFHELADSQKPELNLFISFHSDLKKYEGKINTLLEGDLLTKDEKEIYDRLFMNKSRQESLKLIDGYISTPGNEYSMTSTINQIVYQVGTSTINQIVYQVGFMFHSQDGNTDKAEDLSRKMGW